jgi:hypothetical protein
MIIHVFVLIVTLIGVGPDNAPQAYVLARPFATVEACQVAGKAFIETIQEEKPEGVLGAVAGCQDVPVTIPAPKEKDSI